jgi:hypothetical protein
MHDTQCMHASCLTLLYKHTHTHTNTYICFSLYLVHARHPLESPIHTYTHEYICMLHKWYMHALNLNILTYKHCYIPGTCMPPTCVAIFNSLGISSEAQWKLTVGGMRLWKRDSTATCEYAGLCILLCLHMCMRVSICLYLCVFNVHICIHAYVYVYKFTIYIHIYLHMNICTQTYEHACG